MPRRGGLLSPVGQPPFPPGAGRLGLGARLPAPTHSPRTLPTPGLQKPHRQRDQGIQHVSFEPAGCQHPSPWLHPQQLQEGQPLGRVAPHCRQALGVGSKCPRPALVVLKLGSHHGLQVQDPQGLRDLGAGVHLAVHAHQEGSVQ